MKNRINVPFLQYQVWGYALALGVACTPEQCTELEGCVFNDCGPCPCPTGSICVDGNACASMCSLDVQHVPQGNPCVFLSPDAICEPHDGTPSDDVGVCRAPSGAPMCTPPGDT